MSHRAEEKRKGKEGRTRRRKRKKNSGSHQPPHPISYSHIDVLSFS